MLKKNSHHLSALKVVEIYMVKRQKNNTASAVRSTLSFSPITQERMKCIFYTLEANRVAKAYKRPCLNRNMNFSMHLNTRMLYNPDSPLLVSNYATF